MDLLMETCIRAEMAKDSVLLIGIVEADETYVTPQGE